MSIPAEVTVALVAVGGAVLTLAVLGFALVASIDGVRAAFWVTGFTAISMVGILAIVGFWVWVALAVAA